MKRGMYNYTLMHISRNKVKLLIGFILLSTIFIYLRIKTLNHLLMWDEAGNILSLRAFVLNTKANPFYWGYFFHPPLYMTFAMLLKPLKLGIDLRLELLSLLFSYVTLLVIYLLSAKLGGWKYAWLSGLFLSMMPASIAYDTWIKRDGLASALGYLAVFLILKRKFLWCAIALSFSLLSKESALFFAIAIPFVLFFIKEKNIFKKSILIYGVVFAITSWWYILFSTMKEEVFNIYFSAANNISRWRNPCTYYFKKLLPDMAAPLMLFLMIGLIYSLYLVFRKRQYRWALPIIVFLSVYLPSSLFITGKAPWLCLSARPALAMIGASGALFLLKKSKRSKLLLAVFCILLASVIFTGLSFSYNKYHALTYPNGWPGANSSKELALYLNEHMEKDDRLMITEFAYWQMPVCPIFLYYYNRGPIKIMKGQEKAEDVIQDIINNKISWLVIADSTDPEFNFHRLVKDISNSTLGKPTIVGWSCIWNTGRAKKSAL